MKETALNGRQQPCGTVECRAAKFPHRKALSRWSAWTLGGELLGTEYTSRDSAIGALVAAMQVDAMFAKARPSSDSGGDAKREKPSGFEAEGSQSGLAKTRHRPNDSSHQGE